MISKEIIKRARERMEYDLAQRQRPYRVQYNELLEFVAWDIQFRYVTNELLKEWAV